jgi:hypothetical protein
MWMMYRWTTHGGMPHTASNCICAEDKLQTEPRTLKSPDRRKHFNMSLNLKQFLKWYNGESLLFASHYFMILRVIRKFLDCYCCNCLDERRWEGRPRSHFRKTFASVCHVTLLCEYALFLLRVSFYSAMDSKIKQCVCKNFLGESSVNLLRKPLKCFMKLSEYAL